MKIEPASVDDLARRLADAHHQHQPVTSINLHHLNRLLEYSPSDMTVTAESGMTWARLQEELARSKQWLPVDPPRPDRVTVHDVVAFNLTGPRSTGFGTIRNFVLGMRCALADGRVVRSGGRVVKNVAGYDLPKLFIGSRAELGIVAEVTFKVRPMPEREVFRVARFHELAQADVAVRELRQSRLVPAVFDLHHLEPESPSGDCQLVIGFADSAAAVADQLSRLAQRCATDTGDLEYAERLARDEASAVQQLSVLPSRIFDVLGQMNGSRWIARLGNGKVLTTRRKTDSPGPSAGAQLLARRIKQQFDPHQILPARL